MKMQMIISSAMQMSGLKTVGQMRMEKTLVCKKLLKCGKRIVASKRPWKIGWEDLLTMKLLQVVEFVVFIFLMMTMYTMLNSGNFIAGDVSLIFSAVVSVKVLTS
jgi:hypothetical protein